MSGVPRSFPAQDRDGNCFVGAWQMGRRPDNAMGATSQSFIFWMLSLALRVGQRRTRLKIVGPTVSPRVDYNSVDRLEPLPFLPPPDVWTSEPKRKDRPGDPAVVPKGVEHG